MKMTSSATPYMTRSPVIKQEKLKKVHNYKHQNLSYKDDEIKQIIKNQFNVHETKRLSKRNTISESILDSIIESKIASKIKEMYSKLYDSLYEELLIKLSPIESRTPRTSYPIHSPPNVQKKVIRDTISSGRKSLLPDKDKMLNIISSD